MVKIVYYLVYFFGWKPKDLIQRGVSPPAAYQASKRFRRMKIKEQYEQLIATKVDPHAYSTYKQKLKELWQERIKDAEAEREQIIEERK